MGLKLDIYNDNFVDLTADFSFVDNSSYFFSGDSVKEAMVYFDLYIDEATARLKRKDENDKIVDNLGISADTVDDFKSSLKNITKNFTDNEAVTHKYLIELWDETAEYVVGDRVRYANGLYKCLQAHTAQATWTPTDAPSLWAALLIDPTNPEVQDWKQPDSTNGYAAGDIVKHNDKYYKSLVDNNVWEPGATGVSQWKECGKDGSDIVAEWQSGVTYQVGDMITYNGKTYRCILANCVWSPNDYDAAWEEITN